MKTNEQLNAENETIRGMLAAGAERKLLAIPNVLHVSVGLKETRGRISDQLCVRVYVKQKKGPEAVPAAELIPAQINGVPTDVHTVGVFEFSEDNTKYRPIKGGIAITNRIADLGDNGKVQIGRGTLGCIAIDTTDNAPVILSNWHVLYGTVGRNGDKVYQPSPTSVPAADLADLPLRPKDDIDKIAVLRRKEISAAVDGAIAAIDVSSCCHCCGIHYSNEINGLSVGNRPRRNTIVGDERAVSGMAVFKVGKVTGRTEGVVVDDNYPTFSIVRSGTTYTFTGQIAIQNIDHAKAFGTHGDSGSVIVNLNNKIVGLYFANGTNLTVKGGAQPFVSLANHISDVLAALKIKIPYSPDIKVISGETLAEMPSSVLEAPIPEPYQAFRERLQANDVTARMLTIGQGHSQEITYLVNHCRPVTVAWRRCEGPAFLAAVMGAVRDGHYRLPQKINGVAPHEVLVRMRAVLSQHGSAALKETMNSTDVDLEEIFRGCDNLHDLIERINRHVRLTAAV